MNERPSVDNCLAHMRGHRTAVTEVAWQEFIELTDLEQREFLLVGLLQLSNHVEFLMKKVAELNAVRGEE